MLLHTVMITMFIVPRAVGQVSALRLRCQILIIARPQTPCSIVMIHPKRGHRGVPGVVASYYQQPSVYSPKPDDDSCLDGAVDPLPLAVIPGSMHGAFAYWLWESVDGVREATEDYFFLERQTRTTGATVSVILLTTGITSLILA